MSVFSGLKKFDGLLRYARLAVRAVQECELKSEDFRLQPLLLAVAYNNLATALRHNTQLESSAKWIARMRDITSTTTPLFGATHGVIQQLAEPGLRVIALPIPTVLKLRSFSPKLIPSNFQERRKRTTWYVCVFILDLMQSIANLDKLVVLTRCQDLCEMK